MKNNKIFLFSLFAIFCSSLFLGCTADVKVELKADGKVEINFNGSAGPAFTKMIQSATGNAAVIFEDDEISMELAKSGFSKVNVKSNKSDISAVLTDNQAKSFLFSSGLFSAEGKKLKACISRKNLENFYSQADEQIIMILDLLLAPVFNDEYLSESEYLETLASFYGEDISKEVSASFVNLTVKANGETNEKKIPLVTLLCLSDMEIVF